MKDIGSLIIPFTILYFFPIAAKEYYAAGEKVMFAVFGIISVAALVSCIGIAFAVIMTAITLRRNGG